MLDANQAQRQEGQGPQGPQPPQARQARQARQAQVTAAQAPLPPPPPPPEIPESREELEALAAKRTELTHQLEGMTDRREELADQLHGAMPAARVGLEERISLLDDRTARVEREILLLDDAIAAGLSKGLQMSEQEPTVITVQDDHEVFSETAINVMVGEALAFVLLGVVLYRWTWRRARERFAGSAPNDPARMDQLQHAVDAIAVEVERISEGQRYVTKMLNAGEQPDFAAGTRHEQDAVPARRKGS